MSLGPDWLEQDQVVAVDNLTLEGRPEVTGQVVRGAAQQPWQLCGVVVDKAPGDWATGRVAQIHGITVAEPALDARNAGREQGLSSLDDLSLIHISEPTR